MVYLYDACGQISDFCHQQLLRQMRRKISWTDGQKDRGNIVYPPPPSGNVGILIHRTKEKEYNGRLASQASSNVKFRAAGQYVCVDHNPTPLEGGSDNKEGKLFYPAHGTSLLYKLFPNTLSSYS
jgi:hypothetical protein